MKNDHFLSIFSEPKFDHTLESYYDHQLDDHSIMGPWIKGEKKGKDNGGNVVWEAECRVCGKKFQNHRSLTRYRSFCKGKVENQMDLATAEAKPNKKTKKMISWSNSIITLLSFKKKQKQLRAAFFSIPRKAIQNQPANSQMNLNRMDFPARSSAHTEFRKKLANRQNPLCPDDTNADKRPRAAS
jgi:hypothetical protein